MSKVERIANNLSARQGKVLRYVAMNSLPSIYASRTINYIEWSDLPHSYLQALAALSKLVDNRLIVRVGPAQFAPTDLGRRVIKFANKSGYWNQ